ncbi:DUF4910 domain-containing protein [Salibacterium sp. K-3]
MKEVNTGREMYSLLQQLFPICRSITGNGVRQTLQIMKQIIPVQQFEVPSGTQVLDWQVPKEWNINEAYVLDSSENEIINFRNNNLHVVGYSIPVNQYITLEELQSHLYSLEEQPDAIPYVTSYYKERWGFCLSHHQRLNLKDDTYYVYIDSELKEGSLTYGELIIPGVSEEEVFLSTYICHPSMANNELSGPVVTTYLAKWLMSKTNLKYTYRIVFIPETIGSITYIHHHLHDLKEKVVAGFNITCVGDDQQYSFLPSRYGHTLADKIALKVLEEKGIPFEHYSFLDRGSDERQYCSPGVDLPLVSLMRTKYGEYPEYHTSLDNLELVSEEGLEGAYRVYQSCIELLEHNNVYRSSTLGEPQLGKRGLYPTLSTKGSAANIKNITNFLAYADGSNDLIDISDHIGLSTTEIIDLAEILKEHSLLITSGKGR